MKRFRAAFKNKSNWPSLITLGLILACSVFSFWDTKFSEQARSAAFALVAVEFFIMLVVHLEEIKEAVEEIRASGREGTQLRKCNIVDEAEIIEKAKEELFFCGSDLKGVWYNCSTLHAKSDHLKRVRLLAMNIDDKKVHKQFENTFGRNPSMESIRHLRRLVSQKNIEIRTVDFPLTIKVSASDIHTAIGEIQVGLIGYHQSTHDIPCIDVTPSNTEWYDYYKNQIELLWAQGTPWPPPTKEGTS